MSTQINQYLIYGAKLNYDDHIVCDDGYERFEKFEDKAFKPDINNNGLHCLIDGMSGEYIYIGDCLAKSENHEMLESFEIPKLKKKYTDRVKEQVKMELGIEPDMKLHLVTHWR